MAEVVMYVDGFNLFYGLRDKYAHAYHWLDLFALAERLRPNDNVLKVRYFTAIVVGEPDAAQRQENYLAALQAHRPQIEVARGRFKKSKARCRSCHGPVTCDGCTPPARYKKYEEKLTDVALGVAMVEDAATGFGDITVLVSTDTDFEPAIEASLRVAPHRLVYRACPPGTAPGTKHTAPIGSFNIAERHLKASLLPDRVALPIGPTRSQPRTVVRPAKWH